MAISLRRSFLGLWLGWTLAALAVAAITLAVFERTGAALTAKGRVTANDACVAAGARYRLLSASGEVASTTCSNSSATRTSSRVALNASTSICGKRWMKPTVSASMT